MEYGTVNIWLLIGIIVFILYALFMIYAFDRKLNMAFQLINLNSALMAGLVQSLEEDASKEEKQIFKIEKLEAQLEYLNDKIKS